jgi:putative transposase
VARISAANIQDYHGAKHLLRKVTETVDTLQYIWADGMYEKDGLVEWVRNTRQIALDVVKRSPDQQGFVVVPRRWVVERSFAWPGAPWVRYRRLSKDYERCTRSSEGMIYLASIHTILRHITT